MRKIKNVLYLGWLGEGNVGDDVLFELFKVMFYKYATINHQKTAVNIDAFQLNQQYEMNVAYYDLVVLGGGSLLHLPYWLKICKDAMKNGVPVTTWGTGIDGYYKNNPKHTASLEQTISKYKSIYEQFSFISVRGPITKNILRKIGLKSKIHEIGDPALLYAVETFGEIPINRSDSKQILINWGTAYNRIFGFNESYIEQQLTIVIRDLLKKGYSIKLYPIWINDISAVNQLKEKINDNRCLAQLKVLDAKTTQKMILDSYLTINFKLHPNIFSASANKPFISFAYRGKCFDFSETVNCTNYTIATDDVSSNKIIHLIDDINENYDDVVKKYLVAKKIYYPRLIHSIQSISSLLH